LIRLERMAPMDGANSAMQGRLGFKQIDKQRLAEKAAKLRKAGLFFAFAEAR